MKNLRQIKVKFLGPTNHKGARIKIYEPKRRKEGKEQSKFFPYCYETGNIKKQAIEILKKNNFVVVSYSFEYENYILLCDNWGEQYLEINNIKN